jgi:hypothetical protein
VQRNGTVGHRNGLGISLYLRSQSVFLLSILSLCFNHLVLYTYIMLEQESSAWLVYSTLFSLTTIILLIQSIHHWHIMPFTIFSLLIAGGHLYIALVPYFSQSDVPWQSQEPIINQIPAFSILVFAGIVDWQFVYLRFIVATLKNYRRWGSLHPVAMIEDTTSEDSAATAESVNNSNRSSTIFYNPITTTPASIAAAITKMNDLEYYYNISFVEQEDIPKRKHSVDNNSSCSASSKRLFWIYIITVILYAATTVVALICGTVMTDQQQASLTLAICTSIMTLPSIINVLIIVYKASKCHTGEIARIIGQNRQEAIILILMPLLLMIVMINLTIFSWLAYTLTAKPVTFDSDETNWIILKAFAVYLPLYLLLICCILKQKKLDLEIQPSTVASASQSLLANNNYNCHYYYQK